MRPGARLLGDVWTRPRPHRRELLPLKHGFPARLVVAGLYGYTSATKWLGEIKLTTWESFDAYWIRRG